MSEHPRTLAALKKEMPEKSPAEGRWRAAWAREKSLTNIYASLKLSDKTILTPDKIAGSIGYKVTHLSAVVPEDQVTWYESPQFRFTPIENDEAVIGDVVTKKDVPPPREFLRGGPRTKTFFEPKEVVAAIATCGGICPGLNSVIRELVLCLWYTYGVRKIYGIRYGYEGLDSTKKHPLMELNPEVVSSIHHMGGTILGTSRGEIPVDKMRNTIKDYKINQIYLIGGDGTHRGAEALTKALLYPKNKEDVLKVAVIGIPKTIDNDIDIIDKSFGFDTAVEEATKAITRAHVEAKSTVNGIGLVILMGRASGFIALQATLASGEVNTCLIPEVSFVLDGPHGFLRALKSRLRERGHCVIVVAEGAGADLISATGETDKSNNPKLPDIGGFMKAKIKEYMDKPENKMDYALKYIDPSYMIRSVPANAADSVYTLLLSQNAVYAAMAGFTGMTVGLVNNHYCYIPISALTKTRKVDPNGNQWQRVIEITGQPDFT